MKIIFILIIFCCYSIGLEASFTASNNRKLDANKPTHIIVVGHPDNLGELFVYSALTKAKFFQEKSKDEQVVIIGRSADQELVENAGFHTIEKKSGLLKPSTIKDLVKKINNLSSIDIFAHTNPYSGATLDNNSWVMPLLGDKDDLWNEVAKKINKSSFIFIHGCTSGFKLAPALAKKLNIAVFGSLTSTDFQYIYKNSFWSFDYDTKAKDKDEKNNLNFSSALLCGKYCTRMKPNNSPYKGHWGDWSAGGYPTYKLFCGSNQNTNCELGALEALSTFPSNMKYNIAMSDINNFKELLYDFMCPFAYDQKKQNNCKENLENSLLLNAPTTYSPFHGKTLICDRESCKAHFNCSAYNIAFNPDLCTLMNDSEEESTTFVDEFRYYISLYNKYYAH